MTSPRRNPGRELFGVIGSASDAKGEQARWNAFFKEEGMDAFMDYYPTKEAELSARLSEMFHFDRRGYIVGKSLQKVIIPLLDQLHASVKGEGMADTVLNEGGVLVGYFCGGNREARKGLWRVGE